MHQAAVPSRDKRADADGDGVDQTQKWGKLAGQPPSRPAGCSNIRIENVISPSLKHSCDKIVEKRSGGLFIGSCFGSVNPLITAATACSNGRTLVFSL
jgi:hypothetical protein